MSGTTIDSGLSADAGLLARLSKGAEVNPLGAYASAAQAAQGIWQNRQHQADQLSGEAYQGAIDPTGAFNPEKYRQNILAAGPNAALAAERGLTTNQSLSNSQLAQAKAKTDWVNNAASALLDKGQISDADIMGVFAEGAANGMLTSGEIAKQTQIVMGLDQAGRQQWARQHQLQHVDAATQLQRIYGTTGTVQNGPAVVGTTQASPEKGGGLTAPPGQGVSVGQTESELNTPTQIGTNPDGTARMGTRRQANNLAAGRAADDDGPKSPLGTGRLPPALQNPANKPAATPGDAPPAAPAAPGYTVGQPPAAKAAQEATGATSAAKFQQISTEGVQARSQNAILGNMLADVGQFTTGPGAEGIKRFQAVLQRIGGIVGASFGINADKVAANESFDKFAAQLANAQGAGTDARLAVNQHANPNATMTPAGVDLILRQLQGNSDYLGARAALAAKWGDKGDSAKFENDVGGNLDPRAFQYARMTGPQKTTYVAALSATDRKALEKSYNYAHAAGLLE
jgi:hypothetical protein